MKDRKQYFVTLLLKPVLLLWCHVVAKKTPKNQGIKQILAVT